MKLTKCYLPPVHQMAVLERNIFLHIQVDKKVSCVKIALSKNGIFKKCSISFVWGLLFIYKVVSNVTLGRGVGIHSAVIVGLSLSGSTLSSKAFSTYDFTLDVVSLTNDLFMKSWLA